MLVILYSFHSLYHSLYRNFFFIFRFFIISLFITLLIFTLIIQSNHVFYNMKMIPRHKRKVSIIQSDPFECGILTAGIRCLDDHKSPRKTQKKNVGLVFNRILNQHFCSKSNYFKTENLHLTLFF